MPGSSYITVTDHFCGCGGSSEGAKEAGAEIVVAANHWALAIESHNANHPDALHIRTDISTCDPRRWPRTTIMIASPECTSHSLAKGKATPLYTKDLFGNTIVDPAEERSRMTMWDVHRFAEVHRYEAIIVENVVDVRRWVGFNAWLQAMRDMGYEHECVYLNSMFCYPTPQSRDRIYIVFWKCGNRRPDLRFCPPAWCHRCERRIEAVQTWKRASAAWGRYGQRNQYTYTCPDCHATVHPYYTPALMAIDWSLPAPRIGSREKPLKPKTMERIKLGLERYKDRYLVVNTEYTHATNNRATPIEHPWPTQTGRQGLAFLSPLIGANRAHGVPHPVDEAAQTVNTGNHLYLLTPFIAELRNNAGARDVGEALATVTAGGGHHGLTIPPGFVADFLPHREDAGLEAPLSPIVAPNGFVHHGMVIPPSFLTRHYTSDGNLSRGLDEPLGAVTAADHHSLTVGPAFLLAQRGGWAATGLDATLGTQVAQGSQHAMVVPPSFLASYYGQDGGHPLDEPLPTVPTVDRHALVRMPFVVGQYGDSKEGYARNPLSPVDEQFPTLPVMLVHRLAQPGPTPDVEDCGFRMLEPHEIKRAMAFRDDYIIYGNKREQVKQAGNAVTPPAMRWLVERVLATLG